MGGEIERDAASNCKCITTTTWDLNAGAKANEKRHTWIIIEKNVNRIWWKPGEARGVDNEHMGKVMNKDWMKWMSGGEVNWNVYGKWIVIWIKLWDGLLSKNQSQIII